MNDPRINLFRHQLVKFWQFKSFSQNSKAFHHCFGRQRIVVRRIHPKGDSIRPPEPHQPKVLACLGASASRLLLINASPQTVSGRIFAISPYLNQESFSPPYQANRDHTSHG